MPEKCDNVVLIKKFFQLRADHPEFPEQSERETVE